MNRSLVARRVFLVLGYLSLAGIVLYTRELGVGVFTRIFTVFFAWVAMLAVLNNIFPLPKKSTPPNNNTPAI